RLQYPIEVPPGRNGIQPHLAFTYSSAKGNGWLGMGWDLQISRIEIDTRSGVPDYGSPNFSLPTSVTYLLDSEPIVAAGNDDDENLYHRRVEGRFDRIKRLVDEKGCVTGFIVSDKAGTVYTYGGPGARLVDPDDAVGCNAFEWKLSSVKDTFNNIMK